MRFCLLFIVFHLLVIPCLSQTPDSDKTVEISVCQIKLTNPTANFRMGYRFFVSTDEKGNVSKIDRLGQNEPTFVDIDLLKACIQDWKLDPNEKAFVSFNVGTSSFGSTAKFPNFFVISQKSGIVKINLLEPLSEILKTEKDPQK